MSLVVAIVCIAYWLIVVNSVALCTLWFVCVLMFGVVGFRWVCLISIVRVFGFLLDCDGWILI